MHAVNSFVYTCYPAPTPKLLCCHVLIIGEPRWTSLQRSWLPTSYLVVWALRGLMKEMEYAHCGPRCLYHCSVVFHNSGIWKACRLPCTRGRAPWNQPRLLLFLDTVLCRGCMLLGPQPPVAHDLWASWILDIVLIMLCFADYCSSVGNCPQIFRSPPTKWNSLPQPVHIVLN